MSDNCKMYRLRLWLRLWLGPWLPAVVAVAVFLFLPTNLRAENGMIPSWPQRQKIWLGLISKQSMELNRQGYAAYTRKEYGVAAAMFEKAIQVDPINCFAYFNQACTLSLMYGQGDGREGVVGEIVRHLVTAVDLDSHWADKAITDTDLDPIRRQPVESSLDFYCPGDACPDLHFEFYSNGTMLFFHKFPEISGRPGAEKKAVASARKRGSPGRFTILGNSALGYIPGMTRDLERTYFGASLPWRIGTKSMHAGSPGHDVLWSGVVLDSAGNVTGISR